MIAYNVRLAGGVVRFVSAPSKLAAAELALSGPASPRPLSHDSQRPPACFVRLQSGNDVAEPFWHADIKEGPGEIAVEDLNASNHE